MDRNLDGIYFRIRRDEKFKPICFSDMTEKEQDEVLERQSDRNLKIMCKTLALTIKLIGEKFDLRGKGEEVDD